VVTLALDSLDQFEGAVVAVLNGLLRLAPAAIQNGVGGGDFCCGRRTTMPLRCRAHDR
jgi:hypothetical protein